MQGHAILYKNGVVYMSYKMVFNEILGAQLKEFRNEYKVKAKDIAEQLDKSPAYVSKLEKGQIKQLDKKEFEKITNYITQNENGYNLFFEKYAEKISVIKAVEKDLAFINYDQIERMIPVDERLIKEINELIQEVNISVSELAEYINKNEDLSSTFLEENQIDPENIEKNIWHCYTNASDLKKAHHYIYLEYSASRIEDFLNGKIHKCEYMFLYALVYHLLKAKHKKEGIEYNDVMIVTCQIEAENILLDNKFYSLAIKNRRHNNEESLPQNKKILSKAELENTNYVLDILHKIHFLSKQDLEYTNDKLKIIVENLKEKDISFVFAFMATSLKRLDGLQTSLKKEFLNDLVNLVDEYANKVGSETNIEKY